MLLMGKLGYWQDCKILRMSDVKKTADHGKETSCIFLELDISALDANSGKALNKRFLVVRVLNKKFITFLSKLNFPCSATLRLYASGYRNISDANRRGSSVDVYEIIIND